MRRTKPTPPSKASPQRSEIPAEPRVGVVIPVHNHSKYLRGAVDSILNQTYKNILLAIVDDGSSDDSLATAQSLLTQTTGEKLGEELVYTTGHIQHIPTIIIHNPKARKQGFARNQGLIALWDNVTYFFPLDADDRHEPTKIQKCVNVANLDPKRIGLVYNDVIIYDEQDGSCYHEFRSPYDRNRLEISNTISNSPLISKLALALVGLYDESLPPCEDWDLWLRITEHFTAIHIPEPLQVYTITPQSCTVTVSESDWNMQRSKVMLKMMERRKSNYGNSNETHSPSQSDNRQ